MDFLIVARTVISLALVSGALAVIVSVADKVLNNYGECKLDINDGQKQLTVEGGSSLLSTLAGQKIFIPSACGGKATCGLCKVQVLSGTGAGQVLPTEEPYLTEKEMPSLLKKIRETRPHILLVALGAPKQEYWIKKHLRETGVPVAIGVGGSFDVIAGHVKRAPLWVQKAHLEWLYRLLKEPWRYKRMLSLPRFMGLIWQESRKKP